MMRHATLAVVVLSVASTLVSRSNAEEPDERWLEPQPWRRDTEGPVLSLGGADDFDSRHVLSPTVAMENGLYYLWYVGSRGKVADRVFQLGLATSDDGRQFQKHADNPVLRFADGRRSILTPTLLRATDGTPQRENGRLRMWFSATDFRDPTGRHTLHEATSTDGVRWSEPSTAQLENCYAPSILKVGSEYWMWYTDVERDPWCVRHARSRDGRSWAVDDEPVLRVEQSWEKGRLFYPCVVRHGAAYLMWYGAYWRHQGDASQKTALGFAVSHDGRRWTRSQNNPVFRPDPDRSFESNYTTSQSVVRLGDGTWRIWYASRPRPPFDSKYFAICTAVCKAPPFDASPATEGR